MNQKHILQGMVLFVAGMMTLPAWADPPGREGTSSANPPVMQELDRMTESPPAGSAQQDSGRHFQAKKRERLIQMLQLDEATRGKLLQRLEQLDQKAEDLRRQRREAFSALREQAKGLRSRGDRRARDAGKPTMEVDPGALKTALDRIYAVEEAMAGLRRDRWQVARDLLTPEQQVKFLMYSVKFHKEMRERLEREQGGRPPLSGQEQEKP